MGDLSKLGLQEAALGYEGPLMQYGTSMQKYFNDVNLRNQAKQGFGSALSNIFNPSWQSQMGDFANILKQSGLGGGGNLATTSPGTSGGGFDWGNLLTNFASKAGSNLFDNWFN